jgi:hypothetical protein
LEGGFFEPDSGSGGERDRIERPDIFELFFNGKDSFDALPIWKLICFGEQGHYGPSGWGNPVGEASVEFGYTTTNVNQQHDALEVLLAERYSRGGELVNEALNP